ncbi:hypothetical protein JKP88DRAFT_279178 [Tribonema minus]|uniref:Uncharacterized protein n=1 Tax=Tribonema minus TaxID=303371 RepID=A0A835Z2F5_9STRA|nr:hypothetical protein JKP88DRAFT_279178 [Tribonema minus]
MSHLLGVPSVLCTHFVEARTDILRKVSRYLDLLKAVCPRLAGMPVASVEDGELLRCMRRGGVVVISDTPRQLRVVADRLEQLRRDEATAGAVSRVSGVPTLLATSNLKYQFNVTELAHRFLAPARKFADVSVTTSGWTALAASASISASSINASNRLYTAPASNKYATSATLHNGTGMVLAPSSTPEEIQLNTFSVTLTSGAGKFDEGVVVKAVAYNLVGNSSEATGAYLNPADGTTRALRIDTVSVAADRSAASFASNSAGQHVSSGTGTYPSTYGAAYDHTQLLTSNEDAQLVSGVYVSRSYSGALCYRDYTGFYTSGGLTFPDYSTISASSALTRWVTFKYTGRIVSGSANYVTIDMVSSGLTADFSTGVANHALQIKVVDSANTYTTGWMNCIAPILGTGLGAGSDGTACGYDQQTVAKRKVYILTGSPSTCTIYVRVGMPNNIDASITSATVTASTAFV